VEALARGESMIFFTEMITWLILDCTSLRTVQTTPDECDKCGNESERDEVHSGKKELISTSMASCLNK
jgi:hypothetical protein